MKMSKEFLLGFAAIGLALAVTFGVGEVLVRVIASQKLIYNIEMVRYAKLLKMRDPTGEVSHLHRPNASAELMGVEVKLNSLGNRSPELSENKTSDRKRVLVLGSSVTMGWGVPLPEVFTSLVDRKLNEEKTFGPYGFEFINAGVGNYNTYAQYKLFERQYPLVRPDFVVLHYFISDAEPRPPANNNPILKHSLLCAFMYDRVRNLLMSFNGRTDLFHYYREIYRPDSKPWLETQALISKIRNRLAQDSVPFLIMIVPDFHNLQASSPYGEIYADLEKKFTEMGISVVNLFPKFKEQYADHEQELWIQPEDPHPNAKGHALMAKILYDYMLSVNPLRLKIENK